MIMANYVKFYRGSALAFQNLADKNNDTLYFITDSTSNKSKLYLGEKLIAGDFSELNELKDILISEVLQDNQILVFNNEQKKWINKSIIEAIGIMSGASKDVQGSSGLVPAPGIGQNNLFLRGDGVWAAPAISGEGASIKTDEQTISLSNDGVTITLKDFGIKYYKYIPKTENIEAHYEAQIVDNNHPWKENLEPKVVVDENGQFVLGWFEEDPTNNNNINLLLDKTNELNELVEENKSQINVVNTSVKNIATLLNDKADLSNTYTKNEVDAKILEAEHLTRKTFQNLEEANNFIASDLNPENYIYMINSGTSSDNKYIEYLYINGVLDPVGSWDVNLEDYATKNDIQIINNSLINLDTRVGNIEEFMNSEYFTPIENIKQDLNVIKEAVTWKDL